MAVFTIVEFTPNGDEGTKFEWDSRHHSIPVQPWTFGSMLKTNRVDYPGGSHVTEQVLGPRFTPFSLSGEWKDKFNPLVTPTFDLVTGEGSNASDVNGFAMAEMRRFEEMCRRGNLVRISLADAQGTVSFDGLITEWEFSYLHSGRIGYHFTFSPHSRPGEDPLKVVQTLRPIVSNPITEAENQVRQMEKVKAKYYKPTVQRDMTSSYYGDSGSLLDDMLSLVSELNSVISQRSLDGTLLDGVLGIEPRLALRKATALSAGIMGASARLVNMMGSLKSDTTVSVQSALAVLSFDTWSRGLAAQSRLTIFNTAKTRDAYQSQVDPTAVRIYRPRRGESIYGISNKFYGTPNNARLIRERNKLPSYNLTGEELLIIPEVTSK